jgi:hypothetical protein
LRQNDDAADAFFFAMAYWQQQDPEHARAWYQRGIKSMEKDGPGDDELVRFRAEAAELLGIKDSPQPLGGREKDGR